MSNVAVLAGGLSLEREVSLMTGRRVAQALSGLGHEVTTLDLDDDLVPRLTGGQFDAAFLALHGETGEDGTIQGLLELLQIPYTGPGPTASALAWDKVTAKGLVARAGVKTPSWIAMSVNAIRDMGAAKAMDQVVARLGLPLVVKPAQGGASLGVKIVHDASELSAALVASLSYHSVVAIEQYIDGTEVAISIVNGDALPVVEIVPKTGVYDYSARYTHGATEFYAPARLPGEIAERCQSAALDAYTALGCRNVTRADLIVDDGGQPWFLELDTSPGMTETSLLPMAAQAAGWTFDDLCARLLNAAIGNASHTTSAAPTPR